MSGGVEVLRVAERALLVRFADADLARAVARAQKLDARLARAGIPAAGERVLGAGSLLVAFDRAPGLELEAIAARLAELAERIARGSARAAAARRERCFEVDYGGEAGPDLEAVARAAGLAPERVVELHSGALYRVAFVGFSPGFAYLIGLPRELELPRRATPRARVAAGSVAIAGPFAGVYPSPTPGGWHLIGRAAGLERAPLFDPAASPPAALAPGDAVRFAVRGGAAR